MNYRVVKALVIKYAFICSRNTFRAMDVFFWPVMDLLVWGFLSVYMLKVSNAVPSLITFLIAAVILWNVLFRAQQVVSVSFLDDVWSRNLLNVFAAPIKTVEYVGAACLMGLVQALVVTCLLGILAAIIYSFNVLALGLSSGLLFCNLLMMGWSLGLVTTGLMLRFGPPAEAFVWAVPFLIQPISAVFYPVSVLPDWLKSIALCIPSTHVFEGMRQVLSQGAMDQHYIWCALGLNIIYMVLAAYTFHYFFEEARVKGYLAKYGI